MTTTLTNTDVEPADGSVLQSVRWQGWIWAWVRADKAANSSGEARWYLAIEWGGEGWRLETRKPVEWSWFGPGADDEVAAVKALTVEELRAAWRVANDGEEADTIHLEHLYLSGKVADAERAMKDAGMPLNLRGWVTR
jgi:hypothetical protein